MNMCKWNCTGFKSWTVKSRDIQVCNGPFWLDEALISFSSQFSISSQPTYLVIEGSALVLVIFWTVHLFGMEVISLDEELICAVCRDIFVEPVTLPCGHNYCEGCVKQLKRSAVKVENINAEGGFERLCICYTCPLCLAPWDSTLNLKNNVVLNNIIEKYHSKRVSGVDCTVCKDDQRMFAEKSCQLRRVILHRPHHTTLRERCANTFWWARWATLAGSAKSTGRNRNFTARQTRPPCVPTACYLPRPSTGMGITSWNWQMRWIL